MNSQDLKQVLGIYEKYILEKQENKLLREQIKAMQEQLVILRKENYKLFKKISKKNLIKRFLNKFLKKRK